MEEFRLDATGQSLRPSAQTVRAKVDNSTIFKRGRPFEDLIRYALFLCGALSILITIGFIIVLGSESLRFFSQRGWINSNNRLTEAISPEDTLLNVTERGRNLEAGQVIRIGQEMMLIEEVISREQIVVQRGFEGSTVEEHPEDGTLFVGESVTLTEFFTGTRWQPQTADFGIWPLLLATLITSFIAMLVALPLGLGAAIYLSEYAPLSVRARLKPILEILAGIPTVVYGYFALTFMTPVLRAIFGQDVVQIYNMASAGLVMGIMIVPTVASMSEDALSAVPRALREGSLALGATRFETVIKVLLPAALSGVIAAFILAMSRAVGETMIVAIAAGAGPNFTLNPFVAAETITGHIARISTGDLSFNSIDYNSLFALGLALFVITLFLNVISGAITRRFREVYQ